MHVVRVVVSLGLIALLLSRVDLAEIGRTLLGAAPWPVLGAFLTSHFDRALQAWKWRALLQSSGVPIGFGLALSNTYIGNFTGQFLPSGVGGDVVRIVLLRQLRLPVAEVTASIVIERGFGMLALVVTAAGAFLMARWLEIPVPDTTGWVILGILAVMLAITAASFRLGIQGVLDRLGRFAPRVSKRLETLADAYRRYGKRKRVILQYFALSVFEVAVLTMVFFLCARALGIDVAFLPLLLVVPVTLFLQRIPVSINGIGVQEGSLAFFLVALGRSMDEAVALSVFLRILELGILVPGGILLLRFRRGAPPEDV